MFVIYENISWKQSLETGFDRTCSGITVFINTFVGFILLMNNSQVMGVFTTSLLAGVRRLARVLDHYFLLAFFFG